MDLLSYRHQYTATYIPLLHVKTNSNGFATSSLPSTIAERVVSVRDSLKKRKEK